LFNAIVVCVLFLIKELSVMCYIVISRLPIRFSNCSFNLHHLFAPILIPAFYEHDFLHQKNIAGPDI
jgi:hypothetical protein